MTLKENNTICDTNNNEWWSNHALMVMHCFWINIYGFTWPTLTETTYIAQNVLLCMVFFTT